MWQLILILCLSLRLAAQTTDKPVQGLALHKKYQTMADQIALDTPQKNRDLLLKNAWVVQKSDKQLRYHLSGEGLSDQSIDHVELQTWQDLAATAPDTKLEATSFETHALTRYGGLLIRSVPQGASILVNGQPWGNTTAENGVSAGVKHITLKLAGYADSTGDVEVVAGKMATFTRQLIKKQKK